MIGCLPQTGDIYRISIHNEEDGWGEYHLLVLQFFEAIKYRGQDCAARCLVLESGQLYEVYADVLLVNGDKVA
jgi:hypothetical protein